MIEKCINTEREEKERDEYKCNDHFENEGSDFKNVGKQENKEEMLLVSDLED